MQHPATIVRTAFSTKIARIYVDLHGQPKGGWTLTKTDNTYVNSLKSAGYEICFYECEPELQYLGSLELPIENPTTLPEFVAIGKFLAATKKHTLGVLSCIYGAVVAILVIFVAPFLALVLAVDVVVIAKHWYRMVTTLIKASIDGNGWFK